MSLDRSISTTLLERATRVVPGGIYGHQTPHLLVKDAYPSFLARGEGAYIWDVDGNRYLDYVCSYGPIVLGHRHPAVEAAVDEQRKAGSCFNLPGEKFVELAELLVAKTPFADWALFGKNGSDMTTWALTVARAHTGRPKILVASNAYHGVSGWCNPVDTGKTPEDTANILHFPFNDINALTKVVQAHADELAGILISPFRHDAGDDQELPHPDFHPAIRNLCDEHGIVYILDDVRCGFRLDVRGSGHYYGVEPDLSCYCKAMGNGYAISATVGRDELRQAARRAFVTGSYWTSAMEMAAAIATITELDKTDGCAQMKAYGINLQAGLEQQAAAHGLEVRLTGEPAMMYMSFGADEKRERMIRWCTACIERGVFFHPRHNWFLTTAHSDADLAFTLEVTDAAFKAVQDEFGQS